MSDWTGSGRGESRSLDIVTLKDRLVVLRVMSSGRSGGVMVIGVIIRATDVLGRIGPSSGPELLRRSGVRREAGCGSLGDLLVGEDPVEVGDRGD